MTANCITSPDDPALLELCNRLAALADTLDRSGQWPEEQLRLCGEYGVYQWFLDPQWGGQGWDEESIIRGYLALSSVCLTTTFILTQRSGACRRIACSDNRHAKQALLGDLASGRLFATVGISHLTTSRRHLARPVLRAERAPGGFILDGFSPWVTGANHADYLVLGATLMEQDQPTDQQLLVVLPTDLPGVSADEPAELVGVSASHTGQASLDRVFVDEQSVLGGPAENVMSQGAGATTGGHQTSALALGLTQAALRYVESEAAKRDELRQPLEALSQEFDELSQSLFALTRGEPICSNEQLRLQANSLALRTSQAALAAAKGTGYLVGHPAGRWCREALFFLVWSCPQPVVMANLCELAGIES